MQIYISYVGSLILQNVVFALAEMFSKHLWVKTHNVVGQFTFLYYVVCRQLSMTQRDNKIVQ